MVMRCFVIRLLVTVAVSSVACAGARAPHVDPTGTSDLEIPPPPREPLPEGYEPRLRPPESAPEVLDRASPRYPDAALADEVACAARLLYHILTDGSVALVRLEWEEPPPLEVQAAFEESIQEAIAGWRYNPGRKWIPTKLEDGSTTTVPQSIPKAERALVTFRVEGGQGIVE